MLQKSPVLSMTEKMWYVLGCTLVTKMFGTFVNFSPEMVPVSIKKDMTVAHTYFTFSIQSPLSWIPAILVKKI